MENDLGRDPIRKLVLRIALPSMLGQFVSVLYSIVDRMYIGNIPGSGSLALAGAGVCGPVLTMIGSVSFWIGVGGSPLMSMRMGEGKNEEAGRIQATCFVMLCAAAVILMAAVYPIREGMLRLFGASDATMPYALSYFSYYLAGTLFALLSTGMNQFIICQGFAKVGMLSVVIGAVCNIVLDPVFIFVLGLGVRGAAIATVISQAASCFYALHFLLGQRAIVRLKPSEGSKYFVCRILTIGFTPFIIIAIDNVMIIVMNAVLQHYGGSQGDLLITSATIAQSFMLVVTMPLGGISGGTQTILGYNFGARKPDRILSAQKFIIALCVGYAAIMFVAARTFGSLFVSLFTSDPDAAEKALWAIHVCTLMVIPLGLQYELVDGFTGLGQVQLSLPLSFFRKFVYFAAVFILPVFLPAESAFYAEPLSDLLGPIASTAVYVLCMKKVLRKRMEEPAGVNDTMASRRS